MDAEELISHFPSQEELDQGYLVQVAEDQARGFQARARPMTDSEAELRRDGLLHEIAPMAVEPMSPEVDVAGDEMLDVSAEEIEQLLPLPDTPPMVWCETCGKMFQYDDPQRKGLAVVQLRRHMLKEHGAGYDTRGKNPERRAKKIGRSMRGRGLVNNPWGGKGKPKDQNGPRTTDVSPTDEPSAAAAG